MKQLWWLMLGLALAGAALDRRAAAEDAAEASAGQSVDDAGRALGRWWRFPWYDRATDNVKPVLIKYRDPPNLPDLSFLTLLGYVGIGIVLAGLIWVIVSALLNYAGFAGRDAVAPRVATRVDHVEALPFMAQRSLDDLLGQARQHYLAGNFDEAIIYLFSYKLVELDRRNLIRLSAGKTNRQYLRELRGRGTLPGLLEQTMVAFEDVYFGGHPLSRQRFESCWQRLPEFEAQMASFDGREPARPAAVLEAAPPFVDTATG